MDFLNYTDWQDTADTLHMLLQMSGKVKLLYRAKRPEWAHIRQYLTLDGISTGIVPEAPVPFEINFDFREDQVVFRNYNGKTEKVALEDGKSVGDYYRQFMAALKQIDVPARIDVKSQEFYDPVDLDKDGKPKKWMVENSWGAESGYKGHLIMTDEWFNEYMFRLVVEKKYVPEKVLNILKQKPVRLPAWDPMFAPEE
jgi:hypothetical protein